MSAMMLDEEELKARQTEKVGNDLSRPSIGGNEQVRFVAELAKKFKEFLYLKYAKSDTLQNFKALFLLGA
jgi:hypothetical protein